MLGADFHLGNRFRAFTELHSGTVNGKEPAPLPVIDKNKLDFNQAFLDINLLTRPQGSPKLTLRLGRQQLHFGTGRLVSIREVPNLRAGFDGARVILNTHNWRIDAFATKPVFTKDGFFDDRADHTQTFRGIFGTGPVPRLPFNVDGYYFGLRRKFGAFAKGIELKSDTRWERESGEAESPSCSERDGIMTWSMRVNLAASTLVFR
jgi:hypothetical protein